MIPTKSCPSIILTCTHSDHQISVCRVSYRPHELKPAVVTNQIGGLNKMTETSQIDEWYQQRTVPVSHGPVRSEGPPDCCTHSDHQISVCLVSYRPRDLKPAVWLRIKLRIWIKWQKQTKLMNDTNKELSQYHTDLCAARDPRFLSVGWVIDLAS